MSVVHDILQCNKISVNFRMFRNSYINQATLQYTPVQLIMESKHTNIFILSITMNWLKQQEEYDSANKTIAVS